MDLRRKRAAELRQRIKEVDSKEALARQSRGSVLIDVREADETASGSPVGAHCIPRGKLEIKIESLVDPETEVLLMCGGGTRSLFAAADLEAMGYTKVVSVAGGFRGWRGEGLPIEIPREAADLNAERYERHFRVPEIGIEGQKKLAASKVMLVGAGGLGSPAGFYLAAAGVGTIGVVDDDVVDRSNLQRQILHRDRDVGVKKVRSAGDALTALNPDVTVNGIDARLSSSNAEELLRGYDLVVDGSDNFATRYVVNDACVSLGIPLIAGSVLRFEGQLAVFNATSGDIRGPCYRCLFPEPPSGDGAPSCEEAGVLGALPGVIGTMQAVEAIKLILGIGDPLSGRVLTYDALAPRFSILELSLDPECRCCAHTRATS